MKIENTNMAQAIKKTVISQENKSAMSYMKSSCLNVLKFWILDFNFFEKGIFV